MTITINGIKTNYVSEGSGQTMLILPGWSAVSQVYNIITKQLSAKYRVIVLDLPGFGITEEPKEPWGVDEYVDFVVDFIKELGIKELSIMGHSFGGRIIIKLLNRENLPFSVEKIALVDAAGIKNPITEKQAARQRKFKRMKKFYSTPVVKKMFPSALEKLQNKYGSADYAAASPMMKQCLVKAISEDLTEYIPNITQETILIWGKKDTATPYSNALAMHEMIKNSKLVAIDDAGHFPFIDNPFEFRQIIQTNFIN